mmetsp:Transcript_34267/g.72119  ORF Transcript_34267/g.72119 Transcript_34267/m.72119 type:complete len:223 (-) Transcript_34267:411-1079(-)
MSSSALESRGANVGILNADQQQEATSVSAGGDEEDTVVNRNPDGNAVATNADVGLLNVDENSSYCSSNDSDTPADSWDVYQALMDASYPGSYCAADRADGTTTAPALPAAPGMYVTKIGKIPLPISVNHTKALKSNAWKTRDTSGSYHKVYQIDPCQMKIQNPAWDESLKQLVQMAAYKLGVHPVHLTAELDMLLYVDVVRCCTPSRRFLFHLPHRAFFFIF